MKKEDFVLAPTRNLKILYFEEWLDYTLDGTTLSFSVDETSTLIFVLVSNAVANVCM